MNTWIQQRRGAYIVLFCCTFLAFHNSFDNSFHYDDEHSILENPHIRTLKNIPTFFVDAGTFSGLPEARMYRPLLMATYAVNYAVGEYEVFGYHLINFLLHLINVWLLWEVSVLLLGRDAALWAALFFAAHPLMSEPVNYISSRSSLLSTVFYLGAFLLVLQGRVQGMAGRKQVLLAVCCVAGLLTKSIAITFPVVAGVYLWMQGMQRHWRWLAPPALLGVLYVLGTRVIIGKALGEPVRGLVAQWATQLKALVYYLWLGVMPTQLSVEPQFSVSSSFADGYVLLAGLLLVSLLVILLAGRQRDNSTAFGLYWFFLTLLPSAVVPLNVLVNQHRLYLPMVGASLALAALVSVRGLRLKGIILLVYAVLCIQRNEIWENEEVLWADAVAKGPAMPRPYVNLGKAYLEQMRIEESIETSLKALEIDPEIDRAYYNIGTAYLIEDKFELADAHFLRALELRPNLFAAYNNLGNSYKEQGRYAKALETYRGALKLQEHTQVYHNMGAVWLAWGKVDSAVVAFRRALDMDPTLLESYKGLAKAYSLDGQLNNSLAVLQEAVQRWPEQEEIWWLTGRTYAALKKEDMAIHAYRRAGLDEGGVWLALGDEARKRRTWDKARQYYRRAQEQGRDDARVRNALGETWYGEGDMRQALQAFQQAARLDASMPVPYVNIGRIYLKYGRFLDATAALTRAVELQPDDGGLQALLAEAYRGAGKTEKAIETYQKALQLAPDVAEYHYNLGFIFEQNQQMRQAELMYEAALARQPRLPQGLFSLGTLRLDQERYSEAAVLFERLLAVQPDNAKAYFNLANVWMHMGQEAKTIQAYQRFLSLHSEEDALRQVAERNLAELLKDAQN
jgi:tetratricopeptide (TPR) repeat protein